jgi:hypothetical protein
LLDGDTPRWYATVMLSTSLAPDTKTTPEDGSLAGSLVITLLPFIILGLMFLPFFRFLRRSQRRAEDYMKLNRDMLEEVRRIRELLESKATDS